MIAPPITANPTVTSGRLRNDGRDDGSRNGSSSSTDDDQSRDDHRRQRLERSGEVFQQLKEAEKAYHSGRGT